jgi:protein-tyrosine phosphatase
MLRICFVCLGNICRSPLAEGVLKHLVAQAGRASDFHIESAGLGGWHVGDPPDARAQRTARAHGLTLDSVAQRFTARDFDRFDVILALDREIKTDLLRLARTDTERRKIGLLRDFDPQAGADRDVPDPYYGDQRGFDVAYELIERPCRQLLADLHHHP